MSFEVLPALNEGDESISLSDILSMRDTSLTEEQLWAVCYECCLAMQVSDRALLLGNVYREAVILLAESRKGIKKVMEIGKTKKVLRQTGKNICAGNRKMTLFSHGNPYKLENMAETGKHN